MPGVFSKAVPCAYCRNWYPNFQALSDHYQKVHPQPKTEKKDGP